MAHLIRGTNITGVWKTLLTDLYFDGKEVSPRGMKTHEIQNVTIEVINGLRNVIVSKVRDLNYRFMIAEWLWIQAGFNDVETLTRYNSIMKNFSDDGVILSGAYGPRLDHQWVYVIKSLDNPDTRQAVSTIWTPNPIPSKDIPCTISLQWAIRGGTLHCTVNMRSSDVWLGLPYDYFTFSQLTNVLASYFKIPVGSVTMNLASSHMYENNFEEALQCITEHNELNITSPRIERVPTQDCIKSILTCQNSWARHFPWDSYASALQHNKKYALEVLYELNSSI